jgi:hypothetical protein
MDSQRLLQLRVGWVYFVELLRLNKKPLKDPVRHLEAVPRPVMDAVEPGLESDTAWLQNSLYSSDSGVSAC